MPLDQLEACGDGQAQLPPEAQMRIAAAADRARAEAPGQANERLRAEGHRLVAESVKLSAQRLETMRADVAGLARALRASGAPPERALVLVKSAVHELVTAQPTESEDVMAKILRWFVENYYAA